MLFSPPLSLVKAFIILAKWSDSLEDYYPFSFSYLNIKWYLFSGKYFSFKSTEVWSLDMMSFRRNNKNSFLCLNVLGLSRDKKWRYSFWWHRYTLVYNCSPRLSCMLYVVHTFPVNNVNALVLHCSSLFWGYILTTYFRFD